MFGYIKPYKPELKMRDFDSYQAVYCGLCHQLGKSFGPFSKLTLSYDFTFVAMLASALSDTPACYEKCRCIANPLKKKTCVKDDKSYHFVASCAMSMIYHKLKDNILDHKGIRKLPYCLLLPFASGARKQSRKDFPFMDQAFSLMMERQQAVEEKCSASIDEAAEPTAAALSTVMEALSEDNLTKRVLSRMGYLLGRWVYLLDALDDLEEDFKRKGYNPFLQKFSVTDLTEEKKREIIDYGMGVLNINVAELAAAYELLGLKRYQNTLENIIYLGLKASALQKLRPDSTEQELWLLTGEKEVSDFGGSL